MVSHDVQVGPVSVDLNSTETVDPGAGPGTVFVRASARAVVEKGVGSKVVPFDLCAVAEKRPDNPEDDGDFTPVLPPDVEPLPQSMDTQEVADALNRRISTDMGDHRSEVRALVDLARRTAFEAAVGPLDEYLNAATDLDDLAGRLSTIADMGADVNLLKLRHDGSYVPAWGDGPDRAAEPDGGNDLLISWDSDRVLRYAPEGRDIEVRGRRDLEAVPTGPR